MMDCMCHLIFFPSYIKTIKKVFYLVLTDNFAVRRGLTDNFSATDNLLCKGSRENLLDKQITSIAMNATAVKKTATKHCSWRLCKSDSCYPESIPEGTHFIMFSNVGKVKEGMAEWQKNKQ